MPDSYVILTNKDGQFHTELNSALKPIEQYDYLFCGTRRARFVIAILQRPVRIALVEEPPSYVRNEVPSKFFPTFDSLEEARQDLQQLISFGSLQTELRKMPLTESECA